MFVRIFRTIVAIILFVFFSGLVCVQANVSLSFDPILVERVGKPGEVIAYQVNIDNNNRYDALPLELFVADLTQTIDGVYGVSPIGSTPYSLGDWVTIEPKAVVVPPGGSRSVSVTISIPRGVSGGRYGAIVAQVVPDGSSSNADASGVSTFLFQAASFIELTISGNPVREAYITTFDVLPSSEFINIRSAVGPDAMVFSVAVQNIGSGHINAHGELLILTDEGRIVARYPLGVGRGLILPDSTVRLQTVRRNPLPKGDYQARATVNYGGRRPLVTSIEFRVEETAISQAGGSLSQASLSRFVVSPENLEVALRPGASHNAILEITNRGDETVYLEGYVLPLKFDIYGNLVPEAERDESVSWIELSPSSFDVAAGRTRRVRVTLRPPRDLQGSYFADVLFKSVGEGPHVEAGSNLLATLAGDLQKRGSVEIVKVDEVEGGLAVDALFVNEGSTAVYTTVELVMNQIYPQAEEEGGRIIGARAELIASVELPTSENPVLPGAERLFSFMIPAGLKIGEYEFAIRVDYGGEGPTIGRLAIIVGGEDNE